MHFEMRGRVLVVTWPRRVTNEHVAMYATKLKEQFSIGQPFAIVNCALDTEDFPGPARHYAADFERAYKSQLAKYVVGMGNVYGPMLAMLTTVMNWLAPPPFPKKSFSQLEAALAWCQSMTTKRSA